MNTIVAIAVAILAIVAGGYGLYQVAFKQGYVNGFEEGSGEITFVLDDEGDDDAE